MPPPTMTNVSPVSVAVGVVVGVAVGVAVVVGVVVPVVVAPFWLVVVLAASERVQDHPLVAWHPQQ